MKCVICKMGKTAPGTTTVTLERDGLVLVVQEVPAQVCSNCGEAYVDETIGSLLLEDAGRIAASGAQVDIRRFKGAKAA
ncbi:MAG: type II toxin-antitoxin system MqsA family antitoxin [Candidatus Riflebacteria bacterium]|nr:type II toxin-antitoxin system MqsA family antitoxin [Candidatus Riflebacteria bacterium]